MGTGSEPQIMQQSRKSAAGSVPVPFFHGVAQSPPENGDRHGPVCHSRVWISIGRIHYRVSGLSGAGGCSTIGTRKCGSSANSVAAGWNIGPNCWTSTGSSSLFTTLQDVESEKRNPYSSVASGSKDRELGHYPEDDPSEPCLEPATLRWLDEVARKAEEGDVQYLQRVGRLFQATT